MPPDTVTGGNKPLDGGYATRYSDKEGINPLMEGTPPDPVTGGNKPLDGGYATRSSDRGE